MWLLSSCHCQWVRKWKQKQNPRVQCRAASPLPTALWAHGCSRALTWCHFYEMLCFLDPKCPSVAGRRGCIHSPGVSGQKNEANSKGAQILKPRLLKMLWLYFNWYILTSVQLSSQLSRGIWFIPSWLQDILPLFHQPMPMLQHCGAGSPARAAQVLRLGWGLWVYLQPRERRGCPR